MRRFKRAWRRRYFHWRYKLDKATKGKFWLFVSIGAFSLLVLGLLLFLGLLTWYSRDLPSPTQLVRKEGFTTRINDRNGEIIYDVYREAKRTPVSWEEIPDNFKWATIAIEDKHFYSHPGFSAGGMIRAFYNIIVHRKLQGGSTLTQQLIKNVLLTSERTLPRKFKEFVLSLQVERKYTKDEILLMYLNEAPYGGSAWGVGAAAEQYFDKKVSGLTLIEAVILAGLPQRPSVYSPFSDSPEAYIGRTENVLRRMREDGYISKEEEKEALGGLDKTEFVQNSNLFSAPHFVAYIKSVLSEKYGEELVELGGLEVTTTLDLELQEKAEIIVSEEIGKMEKLKISNGAAVVLNPQTGEILAMVGSKNYFAEDIPGKFNVVTQGLRQPGSAIKPVTYAAALEKNYTAATLLMDVKTAFPVTGQKDYVPVNYDGNYQGPLLVREALGNSINIAAVKMIAKVGLKPMLAQAYQMGLNTLEPTDDNLKRFGLSVTLGGGEVKLIELASAYCAFGNEGLKQDPVGILEVKDRDGRILESFKSKKGPRVLLEGTAFIISHILSDNNARAIIFGPNSALNIPGHQVAVKTGTTNDLRDNWTIGWSPSVMVGVWVGNNDNSPMSRVASGISGAAPIWRRIILAALNDLPKKEFVQPSSVVTAEVDKISGYRAHDEFPSKIEYFIKGTEPVGVDPIHSKLKLCRGQNKLATPAQVASGDYEEKEYFVFKEEDPVSADGQNRWQGGILEWISGQGDERYHPPFEYCGEGEGFLDIGIDSPAHESTVENTFLVKFKPHSIKAIKEIKVYVNDEEKFSLTERPYEKEITLEDGVYTIKTVVEDEDGNTGQREAKFGVNLPWDWQPSPTPSPTPKIPTPTLTLTPTAIPPSPATTP
ncbi:transglycosylase domain-containing protein [Candidatus Shapirobacteria bacterium]|nr:transglycosylase domain-containing protein [Candidatus Shapirobacteria bacterium]